MIEVEKPAAIRQGESEIFRSGLLDFERTCTEFDLKHRFVGGVWADLLNPWTTLNADLGQRRVRLAHHNPLTLRRSDGTVKDIDAFSLTTNLVDFRNGRQTLRRLKARAGEAYPFPSLESVGKYTPLVTLGKIIQINSSIDVDRTGEFSLNYGPLHQAIHPDTLEPWTATLEDGTEFTTLNPFALGLRYAMRVPSGIKDKDKIKRSTKTLDNGKKVRFSKIALLLSASAQIAGGNQFWLEEYKGGIYRDWTTFIHRLMRNQDPLTRAKAGLTGFYWDTIGTDISHGKGPLGFLSALNDRIPSGK